MKSLSLATPHVLIMVGLPGSGKSFFAEKFAETFHAPYISLEKNAQFVQGDLEALTQAELKELVKTKQSVIFDGATESRAARSAISQIAKKAGYETLFIWVQTDGPTAKARALGQKRLHLATETDYEQRVKKFSPPQPTEKQLLVISGKHTYASQAKVVLKKLSEPRQAAPVSMPIPERTPQPSGRRNITVT